MKSFVRNLLIKFFVFMFVVCAAVSIAVLPDNSKVDADGVESTFKVIEDASIRNGGEEDAFTGLQFAFSFNQAWLDEVNPVEGSIGLLVYPSVNDDAFVAGNSITANADAVDGIMFKGLKNVGGYMSASIVFDEDYIASLIERPTQKKIKAVLDGFYAADFTAIAFAEAGNGSYVYSNAYSTSLLKAAARIASGATTSFMGAEISEEVKALANSYLGNVVKEKAYVMNETTEVIGLEVQASEINKVVIGNEELYEGEDYDYFVEGNTLNLSEAIVWDFVYNAETNKDKYVDLYIYTDNGLIVLNVLFGVDEVIDTAAEFKDLFVKGDFDQAKADNGEYFEETGTYVLGADIELANEGVLSNRIDKLLVDGVSKFAGIFDGFGYAVNNATVQCNHSGYYPAGLLGDIVNNAIIKNVAFNNVSMAGTAGSWGILTGSVTGALIENVYVHLNETVPYGIGTFGIVQYTAEFTNVVIKADRAEDFEYEFAATTTKSDFSGRFNQAIGFGYTDNVIVIANNSPLGKQGANGQDFFFYGENETKHWYLYEGYSDETFEETVTYSTSKPSKNVRVEKTYRYNTGAELQAAYENAEVTIKPDVDALLNTGFFKFASGEFVWHSTYIVEFANGEGALENLTLSKIDANYESEVDFVPTVTIDGKDTYEVTDIKVTPYEGSTSDVVSIANGKLSANKEGKVQITLSYEIAGKVFTKSFDVEVVAIVVNDTVDFEASSGLLKTTAIEGAIVKATVTALDFAGNAVTKVLTVDNGGIVDGKFKVLTSYADTYGEANGVPYADNVVSALANSDKKGIRQQMKFVVETASGSYTFNNVMYYTEIIETADEFKALADWDYTVVNNNASYYKLGADINAAGLEYARTNWDKVFGYPTQKTSYPGFRGRFDGAGYTISNFEPASYGLFGGMNNMYDYWTGTATQIVIENVAFENIGSGPVLARFAPVMNTRNQFDRQAGKTVAQQAAGTVFKNIYVSVAEGAVLEGIIGGTGSWTGHHNLGKLSVTMQNILIDATKANVKLAKDNKAYNGQFAETNVVDFQRSFALFGGWVVSTTYGAPTDAEVVRFINEELHNVVILGNIPVALGRSKLAESGAKNNAVDHIDNGDGTYTHQAKAMLDTSDVYAYACNVTTGDIPVITGVKAGFQAALINNDGSDVAATLNYICYICGTPYYGWKLNCPNADCGANNNLNGGWAGNVWSSPAAYTFEVRDLTNFVNPTTADGKKEFVLNGVYKYYDGIINAEQVNLEAFKAAGYWSVVDGALVFGA